MRVFDIMTGILAALVIGAYGRGYMMYTEAKGEECGFYTILGAVGGR